MPKSYQCGRWVGFGGWMGVVVWVVGAQDFRVSPWHFEDGASSKNEDVLAEDGGLLQVFPLAVHLNFFSDRQVGRTILKLSYFKNFFVGPLLHA